MKTLDLLKTSYLPDLKESVSVSSQSRVEIYDWESVSESELLRYRLCDLKLKIETTILQERVKKLHRELRQKGLKYFRPRVFLADEWFSPERVSAIGIPFFLAHPRLKALEKKMIFEVEGGTEKWCLQLLRHEAGHCFDHAYRVSTGKEWQKIFGSPQKEYNPDCFRPRPYSRNFVRHLDRFYAQAHPDEDFAETFAVWLTPDLNWREKYQNWKGALKKLLFVDRLVKELGSQKPSFGKGRVISDVRRLRKTLQKYYQLKRADYAADLPDFYDSELKRIFHEKIFSGKIQEMGSSLTAKQFFRKNKKEIISLISFWTGGRKYMVTTLLKRLMHRCEVLELKLGRSEAETKLEVIAYMTALVTHYLYTGEFVRGRGSRS